VAQPAPTLPPVPLLQAGHAQHLGQLSPAPAGTSSPAGPSDSGTRLLPAAVAPVVLVEDEDENLMGAQSRKRPYEGQPSTPAAAEMSAAATPTPSARPLEPTTLQPAIDWGGPVWSEDAVRGKAADDVGERDFKQRYDLMEQLGTGGYASVHKAVHKASETVVAVKLIDYAKWKINNNGITKAQLQAEFDIHDRLKHSHVVRMHTVFKGVKSIYVVLEMVGGGDLFDYLIQKAPHGISESVARRWFSHLLDGVAYCHLQNIVHRDLKPENIMLSSCTEEAMLKIADFGLAKSLKGHNVQCRTSCGTPQYMAPEVHYVGKGTEILQTQPFTSLCTWPYAWHVICS
jgi:tRNA A-37 threonylcarbamoyl transferase component Bud32